MTLCKRNCEIGTGYQSHLGLGPAAFGVFIRRQETDDFQFLDSTLAPKLRCRRRGDSFVELFRPGTAALPAQAVTQSVCRCEGGGELQAD